MTCSPFRLGGDLNEHLTGWEKEYPALVKEIKDGLYVDDVMLGGDDVMMSRERKRTRLKSLTMRPLVFTNGIQM